MPHISIPPLPRAAPKSTAKCARRGPQQLRNRQIVARRSRGVVARALCRSTAINSPKRGAVGGKRAFASPCNAPFAQQQSCSAAAERRVGGCVEGLLHARLESALGACSWGRCERLGIGVRGRSARGGGSGGGLGGGGDTAEPVGSTWSNGAEGGSGCRGDARRRADLGRAGVGVALIFACTGQIFYSIFADGRLEYSRDIRRFSLDLSSISHFQRIFSWSLFLKYKISAVLTHRTDHRSTSAVAC